MSSITRSVPDLLNHSVSATSPKCWVAVSLSQYRRKRNTQTDTQ